MFTGPTVGTGHVACLGGGPSTTWCPSPVATVPCCARAGPNHRAVGHKAMYSIRRRRHMGRLDLVAGARIRQRLPLLPTRTVWIRLPGGGSGSRERAWAVVRGPDLDVVWSLVFCLFYFFILLTEAGRTEKSHINRDL